MRTAVDSTSSGRSLFSSFLYFWWTQNEREFCYLCPVRWVNHWPFFPGRFISLCVPVLVFLRWIVVVVVASTGCLLLSPRLFCFFYFIHVAVHCFILHCHLLYTRSAHNIWHSPSFPLNQFVCPCYLLLSNLMKLNFSINATPSTAPYDIFCFKNQSFLFWFFIWLRLDRNNQQIVAVNVWFHFKPVKRSCSNKIRRERYFLNLHDAWISL